MRITLLKDFSGKKAGETYELADAKAETLVEAGVAKAAPAPAAGLDPETEQAIYNVFKAAARGAADGGTGRTPPNIYDGGEMTPVPAELKGLTIFKSAGCFLHDVKAGHATVPSVSSVERLGAWEKMQKDVGLGQGEFESKAPSGNFEANDPDGGALVLPEFSQQIVERALLKENFLAETDSIVIRGNMLTMFALDDKSRADGSRSGGVLGAYANEADQLANVSKVKFRLMDLRLKKLYIFAYLTDELLSDSAYALEQYVANKAADELVFKINDGLIRGTGGGQPLGVLNAPCKIAVAKESGQAAATIYNINIEKMWQRCNAAHRSNSAWLINQDCEAALQQMALPVGIAGTPTYLPVGGVSNPSFATLKGRPVKVVEFCETLGTEGDIILVDWKAWQSITKGGVKSDMSMHIRFQYDEMAYRFTYRFDAQPKYDAALTPYKGTNTTSPVITLAAR